MSIVYGQGSSDQVWEGDPENVDLREQLYNARESGHISDVQRSRERVTSLHGILFDLDPSLLREGPLLPKLPNDPHEFYAAVVRPWLERDEVLSRAEVRISGRGLHAILWIDPAIEIETDGERQYWDGVVRVIQSLLPSDPRAPGITAVTRPIGSVNSKNDAVVTKLRECAPVSEQELVDLFELASTAPFETVVHLLTGEARLAPCPICRQADSEFSALATDGRCYGGCGNVSLGRLYDSVFAEVDKASKKETKQ